MTIPGPFHGLAKFSRGDKVRIVGRAALEDFLHSWKFNNPLEASQLAFAGRIAVVEEIRMYHGGYIIYKLQNLSGLWHERLLAKMCESGITGTQYPIQK